MNQIKQILLTATLLFLMVPVMAQVKKTKVAAKPVKKVSVATAVSKKPAGGSASFKAFQVLAAQANVSFTFPQGFKEVKAPDNEDFSFDYGLELPGKEFEIWFIVKSLKENWASYEKTIGSKKTQLANPDSLYLGIGTAHAISLSGGHDFFTRAIPAKIAAQYNADAGRSYLLNLLDMPVTKRYKYALLITLQKNRKGTILAVCLANQKGPEFFRSIDKASNCIKFKP